MDTIEPISENIIPIQYAGFWLRCGAFLLDVVCLIPILALTIYNQLILKSTVLALLLLLAGLLYRILLEYKYSATLGKMICNIRVVNVKYQPINLSEAVTRNSFHILVTLLGMASAYLIYTHESFADITTLKGYARFAGQVGYSRLINGVTLLLLIAEIICLLGNSKKQALHDMLGGTYVVKK